MSERELEKRRGKEIKKLEEERERKKDTDKENERKTEQ